MKDKKLGKKYKLIDISCYKITCLYYRKTGKELLELLKKKHPDLANDIIVEERNPFWQFTGYSAYFKYKGNSFAYLTHYNYRCTPTKTVSAITYTDGKIQEHSGTVIIGSFDYILMMGMIFKFWTKILKQREKRHHYNVIISHLVEMRNYYFKKNNKNMLDNTIFQSFITNCAGNFDEIKPPNIKKFLKDSERIEKKNQYTWKYKT